MIEYFIYCADDRPVAIADLAAISQDAGWSLRVVRNWLGSDELQLIANGDLETDDLTIGWPNTSALAFQFDAAVSGGDRSKLDDWIDQYELSCALWAIFSPFILAEHFESASIDEIREEMGDLFADQIAKTKTVYLVTNCPLMEFTSIVMGAIAIMRTGVIEDPQMGSCIPAPDDSSQLPTFLESWPKD